MGKKVKLEKRVFRFGRHSYAIVIPKFFVNLAKTKDFFVEIDIDEKKLTLSPKGR